MTDEQRYRIGQSIGQLPESLQRDPYVDYTEGVFHVTLNVRERYSVLGVIDADKHTISLTEIGEAKDTSIIKMLVSFSLSSHNSFLTSKQGHALLA
ncbi:MAG: hypothetical protein KBT33_05720 [Prevotellaceae bacterium]|nr:hypothetical protein [Candidatus Minthosoma equi]